MLIYKVATRAQWQAAEASGTFAGAPVDLADGYIHFSTAAQLAGTLAKHFAGQRDLLLIAVDAEALGPALRWEVSRGGDRFPHLYAPLPVAAAIRVTEIALGRDGAFDVEPLP
ncbi:MAG TPA: DUF952 domain-containing protein [Kofleriaceae bacterium]|nr:DUF952 domain-containing protein [Kofleriaceae bacterium]